MGCSSSAIQQASKALKSPFSRRSRSHAVKTTPHQQDAPAIVGPSLRMQPLGSGPPAVGPIPHHDDSSPSAEVDNASVPVNPHSPPVRLSGTHLPSVEQRSFIPPPAAYNGVRRPPKQGTFAIVSPGSGPPLVDPIPNQDNSSTRPEVNTAGVLVDLFPIVSQSRITADHSRLTEPTTSVDPWVPPHVRLSSDDARLTNMEFSDSNGSRWYFVIGSPGRKGGKFVLEGKPLNAGAFGVVHKCQLIHSDGTTGEVAVKRLVLDSASRLDADADQRRLLRRLRREFQMWEKLQHPNIVPILGWVVDPDNVCLVSPWCSAGNIRSYLQVQKDANRLKLLHGVVQGLAYLHNLEEQIVHGDMSLENVLVGDNDSAMLIDFGLSSYPELGIETSMAPHGNQRYMPIERVQALRDDVEQDISRLSDRPKRYPSGDVWSFAFIAHYIVTGQMPWQNYPTTSVYAKLAIGNTPKADRQKTCVPELPAENAWWDHLDRCWSPDPEKRPTMAELDGLLSLIHGTTDT